MQVLFTCVHHKNYSKHFAHFKSLTLTTHIDAEASQEDTSCQMLHSTHLAKPG